MQEENVKSLWNLSKHKQSPPEVTASGGFAFNLINH